MEKIELKILKKHFSDLDVLKKIDGKIDELEVSYLKINPESENAKKILKQHEKLILESNKIRFPKFIDSNLPSEKYNENEFVLFGLDGINVDSKRYESDPLYKFRYDLTCGFYNFINVQNKLDCWKDSKHENEISKTESKLYNVLELYKLLIIVGISDGLNLRDSITKAVKIVSSYDEMMNFNIEVANNFSK